MKTFTKTFFLLILLNLTGIRQAFSQTPNAPVITPIQGTSVICSPDSSQLNYSVTASNSPAFYSWSYSGPNANVVFSNPSGSVTSVNFPYPNANATYTLYCYAQNGAGSSAVVSFVVHVFETPNVTFSGANNVCQGSSTNLSASPTQFQSSSTTLSYNWAPATGLSSTTLANVVATPPSTTNYTVFVTNGPCSTTNHFTLTVNPLPVVSGAFNPTVICKGEKSILTLSGGVNYKVNNVTSPSTTTLSPLPNSNYSVVGTGTNGCQSTPAQLALLVNLCTGLVSLSEPVSKVEIFPNPNNGTFILRSEKNETATILTELGQVIKTISLAADVETKISGLSAGIYFVIVCNQSKKIVVAP